MITSDAQIKNIDVSNLKGVGPKISSSLNRLKIFSLFDLIFHFPFRYQDRTYISKVSDLTTDSGSVLLCLKVKAVEGFVGSRGKVLKILFADDTGIIEASFFNTYATFVHNFTSGRRVLAYGSIKPDYMTGRPSLVHPEITFLQTNETVTTEEFLTPIYSSTEGLGQAILRKTIKTALDLIQKAPLPEILPQNLNPYGMSLSDAIKDVHYPHPQSDHTPIVPQKLKSFERICYEELIAYQLCLLLLKVSNSSHKAALSVAFDSKLSDDFLHSLPFKPTLAQLRVFNEILEDLNKDIPMARLVHGDVGSGKTLVAIMSALQVIRAGGQCVLLSPTDILARQHFAKCSSLLKEFNVNCLLLTASERKSDRLNLLKAISDGSAQFIIGTHAVFQDDVIYKHLALVIIDEQHRFGIEQRIALLNKAPQGTSAHQLVMTATPIPRTLQLALYSDLEVSTIDELPPGRCPVITALIQMSRKDDVIARLNAVCSRGTQAYWVCPHIEEGENDDVASAKSIYEELSHKLPHLKIGLLHGQMNAKQKNMVMEDFAAGKISILTATTIIEVGVDVPNATIMIINNAERLGLAQLHQLRGRVGRGSAQSYCLLLHNADPENQIAQKRLQIMRTSNDGFKIATEDLALRGPGEIIGTKQAGFDTFKVADVTRDHRLIESARNSALYLKENRIKTAEELIRRWFPQYLTARDNKNDGNSVSQSS
ncbi:ATP-dependent DNA helicase RecG [Succinatimonas hippei]|uniref:ATP-dependent DNA helicase RecG n=1 Tax=Succinatimonas hippei TaxID=626938 RepID=UPI0025A32002|nr:ATP-dependent DNA helicase RecG [Succinatimonas hippei]MDM8120105.1 ATP-dependent DNA helicase RecG [Succinatimonas hippei]